MPCHGRRTPTRCVEGGVVATGAARVAMPLVMETAAAAARVAVARVVAPDAAPGRPSGHGR